MIFLVGNLSAQKIMLAIEFDRDLSGLFKTDYKTQFFTEQEARKEINKIYLKLLEEGFLGSSVDSVKKEGSNLRAFIYTGNQFTWGKLGKGNIEEVVINYSGYREKLWRNKNISVKGINQLMERILEYYENHGYPFASIKLDSITIEKDQFEAVLVAEKYKRYKIDSIIIKGDLELSNAYIYNQIGIKPKDEYNESLLKKVDARLREIPFAQVARSSEIVFSENQANLFIYLSKRNASSFNGILGILPDANTGKITITGDARINLKNSFGKGEVIDINWRKLNTAIQDLKLNFNYPFLFSTNIGTDLNFKLYKRDSTFLELHKNVAIQYLLRGGNFFKAFYTHNSSDLLTPTMFANAQQLPVFADVSTGLYGIGLKSEKTDYRINPRTGFNTMIEFSAGNKRIRKNPKLNEELYDNIDLNTLQLRGDLLLELYIPFSKRSVIKLASNNAYIYNENLFVNELMRIGGLKSLRGFNEESILASFYSIESIEYRFLLDQNSALFMFFDYAYYERDMKENYFSDRPYGFGVGMNFSTNAGIFSINYALGTEQGNPILFRGGKVHFGFINYF